MNNKGLSLVELLVAFAVTALVLSGLAYLMFHVMNMFARTNANVDLQNESQTSMNLVVDNIMDATGLCMIETDPAAGSAPVCVLLGDLVVSETDYNSVTFVGDAIIWDPTVREVYLRTYESVAEGAMALVGASSQSEAAIKAIEAVQTQMLSMTVDDRLPYLMSRYVTGFDLRVADYYIFPATEELPDPDNPGGVKTVYYHESPMVLDFTMNFEMEYKPGEVYTREISDEIAFRNRMPYLYLQRAGSGMIKYYCK